MIQITGLRTRTRTHGAWRGAAVTVEHSAHRWAMTLPSASRQGLPLPRCPPEENALACKTHKAYSVTLKNHRNQDVNNRISSSQASVPANTHAGKRKQSKAEQASMRCMAKQATYRMMREMNTTPRRGLASEPVRDGSKLPWHRWVVSRKTAQGGGERAP